MPPRSKPDSREASAPVTVLAVDDNEVNLDLVAAAFDARGWNFLRASDGKEALGMAIADRPDLIISDILMPTMDGFEFVHRLREIAAATPVVFYTATYHEREAQELAQTAGASAVVYKDGEVADLIRAIDEPLSSRRSARAPTPRRDFDEAHARLLTDKLIEKARDLEVMRLKRDALIALLASCARLSPRSSRQTDLVPTCSSGASAYHVRGVASQCWASTYRSRNALLKRPPGSWRDTSARNAGMCA